MTSRHRLLLVALGLVVITGALTWALLQYRKAVHATPGGNDARAAFQKRVELLQRFEFEDIVFVGPPRSQTATVPPLWSGEAIRGEKDPTAMGNGALFTFVSRNDDVIIMVDLALVDGLEGTGILRTAWLDRDLAGKLNRCERCTAFLVFQFFEPGLVYTVTGVDPSGQHRQLYPFTEHLMRMLRNTAVR